MKIKVGDTYLDPNDTPVMFVFEEGDRELISAMPEDNTKIAFTPSGCIEGDILDWMNDKGPAPQLRHSHQTPPQLSKERFCEDCQRKIGKGKAVTIKLDFALDADDGYGDDAEIHLCKECHEGGTE